MKGERGVGPVEPKREKGGSGRGGERSRNCQRYAQAIVATPLCVIITGKDLLGRPFTL